MSVLTELRKVGERREEARRNGKLRPVSPALQVRMDSEAGTDVLSPAYLDHFANPAYRAEVARVVAGLKGREQSVPVAFLSAAG